MAKNHGSIMKLIPLTKDQSIKAEYLVGEWYLIDDGSLKGCYAKHLHTKNVVIIASVENDKMVPWLYIECESTALN